jgi:hypothetical protein
LDDDDEDDDYHFQFYHQEERKASESAEDRFSGITVEPMDVDEPMEEDHRPLEHMDVDDQADLIQETFLESMDVYMEVDDPYTLLLLSGRNNLVNLLYQSSPPSLSLLK